MHHDHASLQRYAKNHGTEAAAAASSAERRTRIAVGLSLAMMGLELVVGWASRSLALTADGWHMATHAGALGLAAAAYWFARTRARAEAFAFGTGKVQVLAGYTNAVALLFVALWMAGEAVARLFAPQTVRFAEAMPVAVLGLLVNLATAWVLVGGHGHDHEGHGHAHDDHGHEHDDHGHEHDLNLRGAYLHVLADALTSVLAIVALLGGRYLRMPWLDPLVALVGSAALLRWGVGLARSAAARLLDVSPSERLVARIREGLEQVGDARVTDLHVWELGPGCWGCIASVVAGEPRALDEYRAAVHAAGRLAHVTIEVERCEHGHPHAPTPPPSREGLAASA